MNVVIMQPLFIPWLGLFEQIRLADVFVHYDDVQLPQGRSFVSRVQIKTPKGQAWLSAQVDRRASGRLISEAVFNDAGGWRERHLGQLRTHYRDAPHAADMVALATEIYAFEGRSVAGFNQHAIERTAAHLGLKTQFAVSSELGLPGNSSQRLFDICAHFGATTYVTGHGALNYLDHELFEAGGVEVAYMDYQKVPYPQRFGDFIPYVSVLDPIANVGADARDLLVSDCVGRRTFVDATR